MITVGDILNKINFEKLLDFNIAARRYIHKNQTVVHSIRMMNEYLEVNLILEKVAFLDFNSFGTEREKLKLLFALLDKNVISIGLTINEDSNKRRRVRLFGLPIKPLVAEINYSTKNLKKKIRKLTSEFKHYGGDHSTMNVTFRNQTLKTLNYEIANNG